MAGERDGGGAAEEWWSVPVPDAPVMGVHLSGESRAAMAPEASLLLAFSCSLICIRRSCRE